MRRALSCFIWSVTCPYTSRVKAAVACLRLPRTALWCFKGCITHSAMRGSTVVEK